MPEGIAQAQPILSQSKRVFQVKYALTKPLFDYLIAGIILQLQVQLSEKLNPGDVIIIELTDAM